MQNENDDARPPSSQDGRGDCVPGKSREVGLPGPRDLTCYSGKRPLTLAPAALTKRRHAFGQRVRPDLGVSKPTPFHMPTLLHPQPRGKPFCASSVEFTHAPQSCHRENSAMYHSLSNLKRWMCASLCTWACKALQRVWHSRSYPLGCQNHPSWDPASWVSVERRRGAGYKHPAGVWPCPCVEFLSGKLQVQRDPAHECLLWAGGRALLSKGVS